MTMEELGFVAGIDHSGFDADIKHIDQGVSQTAKKVEQSGMSVDDFAKHMQGVLSSFDRLTQAVDKNTEAITKGTADATTTIDKQCKSVDELSGRFVKLGESGSTASQSVRMRLRELTQQIVELTLEYRSMGEEERNSMAGQELEKRIAELTREAGVLKDAFGDATREINGLASDTSKWDALGEGLNVAASALGGAAGAASLLGAEEEDLQRIQTALQASLATSNALSVMQNKLQKESSLMIAIRAVQESAAAKAIAVRTAAEGKGIIATKAATLAQTIFNTVAKANPYLLLFTAITTLVGGVYLLTKSLKANTDRHKEAAEAARRHAEEVSKMQQQWADSVASSASQQLVAYRRLQSQWNALGDDLNAKKKFIDDNKSAFNSLGWAVNSVSDAESLLVGNTDAVVNAIMARAKAAAYAETAKQIEGERIREMLRQDTASGDYKFNYRKGSKITRQTLEKRYGKDAGRTLLMGTDFTWEEGLTESGVQKMEALEQRRVKAAQDAKKQRIAIKEDEGKKVEALLSKELQAEQKAIAETGVKAYAPIAGNGTGAHGGTEVEHTGRDLAARIQEERRYQEELDKIRQQAADARKDADIAAIDDNGRRERAEQDEQHKRNIRQIEQQADEMKKAVYEHNKKVWENAHKDSPYELTDEGRKGWQGIALSADQQAIIDAQTDKENAEHLRKSRELSEQLVGQYQSYTDRKLSIDKKYQDDVAGINDAIKKAQERGDAEQVAALQRSLAEAAKVRAQSQADLTLEQLKETPEYVRAFEDLGNTSSETLTMLIDMFEKSKAAAAKSMDPEDLKGYTDALEQMYDEVTRRDPFRAMAASAGMVREAHKGVMEATEQLNRIRNGERVLIGETDKETGEFTVRLLTEEEALRQLAEATDKENRAISRHKKATEEAMGAIDSLASAIQNVGNAMGGTAGEVLGLISSVMTFATATMQAITFQSKATSAALKAVEKGSVILAAASAALTVLQAIDSLFAGGKSWAEKAEEKNRKINAMRDAVEDYRLEVLKARLEEEKWFGSTGLEDLQQQLVSSTAALEAYWETANRQVTRYKMTLKDFAMGTSPMTSAQDNLFIETRKAKKGFLGIGSKSQKVENLVDYMRKNLGLELFGPDGMIDIEAAEQALDKYGDKLVGDTKETLERLIELRKEYEEYQKQLEGYVSDLYSPLADNLTDAVWDWYAEGKDVMDSFKEYATGTFEQIGKEMLRQLIMTTLFDGYKQQLLDLYNDYAKATAEGADEESAMRNLVEGLTSATEQFNADVEAKTPALKAFMQAVGDGMKQVGMTFDGTAESAKTYFESLRDTFKDSLLDMESDADAFKKNLQRTLYEDLIEKNVFDVPFTINGMTFDDFEAYSKDWNERYAKAVADGDTAALDALIEELVDARKITAAAAESYREALKNLEETAKDTTIKDMGGSWVSMLMGMDSDAETWGKEIGRTMAQKIIEQMILADTMQPLLDTLQDNFNRAMGEGSSWEEVLADEGVNAALADIEKAYPELQKTVNTIMDRLGLSVDEEAKQGFSDLRSLMTSALLDTEGDMKTFGKNMAETMLKQMLDTMIDSKYKKRMDKISAEWAEALEAADPARIDAVKQQVMDLYEEVGKDSEIKQLTEDIKALAEGVDDTTTPFDNLRSSYHSWLMDMTKDTKDFTEDLNKMLADAFVDEFVMGKAMDDIIEKYKGQFKSIRDDATLSKEERARQMKTLGGLIAEEAEGLKAETKEVLSWFGLSNNVEDQGAAMNMAESATYDQFELYLGIATAQQINGEQQLSIQQQILATLQSMTGITSPGGETVKEISSRMRTANEYLLSIRDSNKAILDTMSRKLDVINANLSRL